jgi:hypothetical protein
MVPHYTRQKNVSNGSAKNYEQIFANDIGKWTFTHRAVSNWKDSVGLDNTFVFNEEYAKHGLYTVHHVDINRFNNSPNNLVRMNSKDHIAWHRASGVSSKNRAKGRQILAELMQDDEWKKWFSQQQVEGWTEDKRA